MITIYLCGSSNIRILKNCDGGVGSDLCQKLMLQGVWLESVVILKSSFSFLFYIVMLNCIIT